MQNDAYDKAFNIPPDCFKKKPLLKKIYREFYELVAEHLSDKVNGQVIELGAGAGDIKEVIPHCIRTGLFPQPWLDSVENAYQLSFPSGTVSDLILFDVFHHLQYPGTALKEFYRVCLWPIMRRVDHIAQLFLTVFATRLLMGRP